MARGPLDAEIDRLYQLPLEAFTAARNALAKEAGPKAAEIKRLEKPSAAAWAINQLFWQSRALYDQVIEAAATRRDAYRQMLAGKNADVSKADAEHRAHIKTAAQMARALLEKAGSKPTDQVATAIAETLDALPGADAPGRLTKPLKRIGFEGLEGVAVAATPRTVTSIVPRASKAALDKSPAAKDRHVADARERERAMTRERLRFAEAAEREAQETWERAQRTVERVERTLERVAEELKEATEVAKRARREEAAAKTAYGKAVSEREHLAKKLP